MGTTRTERLSPAEHMALAEFLAGALPAGQLDTTLTRAREATASQRAVTAPPPAPGPHLQPFNVLRP
jgi:hypothetical protein